MGMAMFARTVLLAIPSITMAVVGLAMFGPGAVQPFDGARVRGGPTEGLQHISWRITVLQRFRGIDSTRNIGAIVVRARNGGGPEVEARCRTESDGTCDLALDFAAAVSGPIHASITGDNGAMLADGGLAGDAAAWGRDPGHPARLTGGTTGDYRIEVDARRGVFAAPFRDELVVTVHDGQTPLAGAPVTLRTDAADLPDAPAESGAESSQTQVTSDRGEVTFGVAPRMHTVAVEIDVTARGRRAAWQGILPVVPGAIWLDPKSLDSGFIGVVAPVPREVVYFTIATPTARLGGGRIPLAPVDTRGFSRGAIDVLGSVLPIESVPREPKWVTLSSDPLQSGAGTVGWPIYGDRTRDERPFRDQLLLDGLPAAEKRDHDRRYRARSLAVTALGAAAVLEGIFLAQGARANGIRGWIWPAVAIATVVLAFAAIAVVVMWKTSS
jgi:hypothetical protein